MKRGICNEMFGGIDKIAFSESLKIIRETGFQGVEIAPHTLFGDFSGGIKRTLNEIKRELDGEGVDFAGFHWLLVGPEGLYINSPETDIRKKSWDHIKRLADLGGELGGGPMTLGSPAQRSSTEGIENQETMKLFTQGLSSVASHIEGTGCSLLVEALPSEFTDVVNTLEEARTLIDKIGQPGIGGMFDFHNTNDESAPWEELIQAHMAYIAHVHLNDAGGVAPSAVTEEYRKAFQILTENKYNKWVSLEIFTVPEDPRALLRQVENFLNDVVAIKETA